MHSIRNSAISLKHTTANRNDGKCSNSNTVIATLCVHCSDRGGGRYNKILEPRATESWINEILQLGARILCQIRFLIRDRVNKQTGLYYYEI